MRFPLRLSLTIIFLTVLVGAFYSIDQPTVDAQPIFVTNTPPPPDPLAITPDASVPQSRYALRLWQQTDLVELLFRQIQRLGDGDDVPPEAIRLTQYELNQRFPNALNDPVRRERLLDVMLDAPRGTVDMRSVVRPTIVERINAGDEDFDGFNVEITTIDLNGDELEDLYVNVRYPDTATDPSELLYDDHLLLVAEDANTFVLPEFADSPPVAPFDDINAIMLWRVADLTGDGRTNLGLLLDRGELNQELRVYGFRSERVENLIAPGETILVGSFLIFDQATNTINTTSFQLESERWQCRSAIDLVWEYEANFFRLPFDPNARYELVDSIGCAMLEIEPVFARPAERAIEIVDTILTQNDNPNDPGYARANVALAMLYLLNDQPDAASDQIEQVLPFIEEDEWLAGQVETFVNESAGTAISPVVVCSALLRDNPNGACDMDQVLTQFFVENPLSRELTVPEQLDALGLPILDVLTLSQPGLLNRVAVNFNLTGASWWAFSPRDAEFFVPEIIDPPVQFADTVFPVALVEVPDIAYNALLRDDDPARALTILENELRNAGDVPLSIEARYFQAFAYDMLGDRDRARVAYYTLWLEVPDSHYGRLAGAHLERRS